MASGAPFTKYCPECGEQLRAGAEICPKCGVRQPAFASDGRMLSAGVRDYAGKKIAAGVCGILLGSLGIHKFILGLTTPGIIMAAVTVLTCGFGGIVMGPLGLIEGIIYLTKSDEDFFQTYGVEKKAWL